MDIGSLLSIITLGPRIQVASAEAQTSVAVAEGTQKILTSSLDSSRAQASIQKRTMLSQQLRTELTSFSQVDDSEAKLYGFADKADCLTKGFKAYYQKKMEFLDTLLE